MEIERLLNRKRNTPKTLRTKGIIALLLSFMMTSIALGIFLYIETKPNMEQGTNIPERIKIEGGELFPILIDGKLQEEFALVKAGQDVFLSVDFLKKRIDPTIHVDPNTEAIIITTENKHIHLKTTVLTELVKGEKVNLQFPVTKHDNSLFLPYAVIQRIYNLEYLLHETSGVIEVISPNHRYIEGETKARENKEEKIYIRLEPNIKSKYVTSLEGLTKVKIYSEKDDWYYIQTKDGYIGYASKKDITLKELQVSKQKKIEQKVHIPWKPIGEKIHVTWEHVVKRNPNTDKIGSLPGVQVVSPTWFHLKTNEGTLENLADPQYVTWAHKEGYQVWGLVTNHFDPDLTHSILNSYELRRKVILQLLYFAEIYDLDGINIDFENVYMKDKDNLVQFVREMRPLMREQGLVISIDVTVKSTSEQWSKFLDRKALGELVDYMLVMTYDEHWASSPKAGSVASLPWVEKGLQGILEEVSNEKILLGVPFYTRLWKEVEIDGKIKVSSKAYSMPGIEKWLKEKSVPLQYDEKSGQFYGEYFDQEENARYKVWLEDESSMAKRVDLVHKYQLAGVASWRRGFEKPVIWDVIKEGLENPRK